MKKTLKRCLSILLAITIIFGSAYAGVIELGAEKGIFVEANAIDDNKDFSDAMYVVREDFVCNNTVRYVVYLKGGIKISGAVVNIEFDDKALVAYDGGAYTVFDEYGRTVPKVPGYYECGYLWDSANICTAAYVNTAYSGFSEDTPFLTVSFYVYEGYDTADVKFTCVEFLCEDEALTITKADEPVVVFEETIDIAIPEHISGDWVEYLPTVYDDGYRYRECTVCEKVIERIDLPQLVCDAPELLFVLPDAIGLVFGWYSVKGADLYWVYRRTQTTDWEFVAEIPYNNTTYLDSDVEDGVEYYYTVQAMNEAGGSGYNTEGISYEYHIHKFSDWEITVPATCKTEGEKTRSCPCGEKEVISIAVTDHKYSEEWTIDVEPTCKQEGSKSHHCVYCGDKKDITVMLTTDHKYEAGEIPDSHPHSVLHECIYCGETKTENETVSGCLECDFIVAYVPETNSYKLVSYIGNETEVIIPGEYNGASVTEISSSCFKGKNVEAVKVSEGVVTIASTAFMNCSSLERIYIASTVKSIANNAFYGASDDLTIYCYRGSTAREYAIENDIDYVLINVVETEDTIIDFDNALIYTSRQGITELAELWVISDTVDIDYVPSLAYGSVERYGTGTQLTVYDNEKYIGDFTLIVEGDLTGDSVCDVLDASSAYLFSTGMDTPDEYQIYAACGEFVDEITANDYQNIINIMLEN